ncbi:MAG: hypothetical protein V3W18_05090 [candidate division Zixibacteria bacterium]
MPCNDITENIEIVLDDCDRLKSYCLTKKTCGGAVGIESLLLDKLRGRSVNYLLDTDDYDKQKEHRPENHPEEFLRLKHSIAIKSVLSVYVGNLSGGIDDTCTIASVDYDNGNTIIDAQIDVLLLSERIKACAHCGPG